VTGEARTALEQELASADEQSGDLDQQLAAVRHAVAADVDRTWTSAWKSPDTVDAKVRARLAGHQGYQALRQKQREIDERRRTLQRVLEEGSAS
jgi:hypothetical protein